MYATAWCEQRSWQCSSACLLPGKGKAYLYRPGVTSEAGLKLVGGVGETCSGRDTHIVQTCGGDGGAMVAPLHTCTANETYGTLNDNCAHAEDLGRQDISVESAIKALQPVHIPKDSLGERVAQYDKVSHLELQFVIEQASTGQKSNQEASLLCKDSPQATALSPFPKLCGTQ